MGQIGDLSNLGQSGNPSHETSRTFALASMIDLGVFLFRVVGGLCVRLAAGRPGLGSGGASSDYSGRERGDCDSMQRGDMYL